MSEIQKQIRDTLSAHLKAYTEGENEKAKRLDKILEEKSIDWLTHQQTIIDQQAEEIERLKDGLEYYAQIGLGGSEAYDWDIGEHARSLLTTLREDG